MSKAFRAAVCSLVCFAARASAAQVPGVPSPPPPVYVETLEVVATRLPEAPHDVPAPVEVLTGAELQDRGATTLRDALALSAGVEIAPGGDAGPAGAVPEFLGLREFDAFLLVVDGVPWGGAFNPAVTSLSLRDVERVEILRGPAPVTYGATSFVGVIHVVHKTAAADRSGCSGTTATRSSPPRSTSRSPRTRGGSIRKRRTASRPA